MGWSVGRGCHSPLKKGSGKGTVPPPQKFKKKFFWVQCVQKIFVFRPKGGASPSGPPKYATAYSTAHTKVHDSRLSQASRIDKNFFLVYMNSTSHDSIIEFIRS